MTSMHAVAAWRGSIDVNRSTVAWPRLSWHQGRKAKMAKADAELDQFEIAPGSVPAPGTEVGRATAR